MAPARSTSTTQTIAELEEARQSLAAYIDAISDRVSPANVIRRKLHKLRSVFVDAEGSLKKRNVAIAAGVGAVLVVYTVRKRRL
jgi:Protein of unknown function (DUF3618)